LTKERLTTWIEFVDPVIVSTIVNVQVKVLPAYQSSVVLAAVSAVVENFMVLGQVLLGTPVRISQLIQQIRNQVGVDYCYVNFQQQDSLGVGDGSTLTFSGVTNLPPVVPGSALVYVDAVLVGTDNGFGIITGATMSGSIVYETGSIALAFNGGSAPTVNQVISVVYQQNALGDIVVGRNQIAKLTSKNLTLL